MSAAAGSQEDFHEWEAELFANRLNGLPDHLSLEQHMRLDLKEQIKTLGNFAIARAIDIGALQTKQYHSVPLADGKFHSLVNFEHIRHRRFDYLRVTTNQITDIKPDIRRVQTQDFRLNYFSGSVILRQADQLIKGLPTNDNLPAVMPPVVWREAGSKQMVRFTGSSYELPLPPTLRRLETTELEGQVHVSERLVAVLKKLNRSVTLEETYAYSIPEA